ncbi:hydroxyproline-rich glycoprotein DZ-HRGP [Gracilaria domingensis]|nr:hydroxyproline-rich glycoprotein DZ-HRGP [Gracilaria domingensis]
MPPAGHTAVVSGVGVGVGVGSTGGGVTEDRSFDGTHGGRRKAAAAITAALAADRRAARLLVRERVGGKDTSCARGVGCGRRRRRGGGGRGGGWVGRRHARRQVCITAVSNDVDAGNAAEIARRKVAAATATALGTDCGTTGVLVGEGVGGEDTCGAGWVGGGGGDGGGRGLGRLGRLLRVLRDELVGVGTLDEDGAEHGVLLAVHALQGDGDEAGHGGDGAKAEKQRLVGAHGGKHVEVGDLGDAVDEHVEQAGVGGEQRLVGLCKHERDGVGRGRHGQLVLQVARGGVSIGIVHGLPCSRRLHGGWREG